MTIYSDSKRVNERIRDVGDSNDRQQWGTVNNQPPKRAVIRWERFLHVRSIKVLLVENDDSTRHVVTALLRNSNYEVIQAANGMQAWKILEDVNNRVDLVLTEVVMPCLSGIGLLCKIMSHDLRKNIPVIMMSCLDSMALVFNCLSKGAVDFLVKPIRKNELKNLWQHIWRRCHSPSGSESHSSNGSGDSATQTSSTKQVIEVVSSPAVSADNTCSLGIETNNEAQLDHSKKGKELVARKRRKLESKSTSQVSSRVKVTGSKQNALPELDCTAKDEMLAHQSTEFPSSECKSVYTEPQMSSKRAHNDGFKEPVCTELCLKKLPEDADKIVQPFTQISALSRYTSTPLTATTNEPDMVTGKSTQPANNTSLKKERVRYIRPNSSNANFLQSSSHGTSKRTDPLLMSSEVIRNDFSGTHDKERPVRHIPHHHHVHHYNDNNCLFNKLADESPLHDCQNENHITKCSCSDCTAADAGGTNILSNTCLEVKDQCSGETALTNFCRKRKEPCLQSQVNSHRL